MLPYSIKSPDRPSRQRKRFHSRYQVRSSFKSISSSSFIYLYEYYRLLILLSPPLPSLAAAKGPPPLQHQNTFSTTHRINVKLDSRATPPPLHFSPVLSDPGRSSTAETTPIGTPRGFGSTYPRRFEKEKDSGFSWHRKVTDVFAGGSTSYVDSTLLESDLEDSTFPLFGDQYGAENMLASRATPVDVPKSAIDSPMASRAHYTSNLTSALQSTSGNEARATQAVNISSGNGKGYGNGAMRRESVGGMSAYGSHYGSGALPIAMNSSGKPRRESIAGSLVAGMSFGGVSVSSWIRDE